MAPQRLEKIESAPGNGPAWPVARKPDSILGIARDGRSPGDRKRNPEMAPQAIEKPQFAPENGPRWRPRHSHKSNSRCSSWDCSRWRVSPSPRSGEGGRRPDGVRKAGMVRRRFAVTVVQSDLRRSSGPHPIRRFAPPSPASWGRGPRDDLRCVNTVGLERRARPVHRARSQRPSSPSRQ